jgi:hypothetical protein
MRRVAACALLILVSSCSASGEGGGPSTVVANPGGEVTSPPGTAAGGAGNPDVPAEQPGGDIFDPSGDLSCSGGCPFTPAPLLDEGVTAQDITPFTGNATFQAGSLCVLEPQLSTPTTPGASFPRNWLRPRFRWASSGGETLWEVQLSSPDQQDQLRAYTRATEWTIPAETWAKMRTLTKSPIDVTIRGLGAAGQITGVQGQFSIAPVDAGGSMVFWATESSLVTKTSSKLLGFAVGDEAVVQTLRATDVKTGNIPGENGALARGFYACGGDTPRPTCTAEPNNPACCDPTGFEFGQVECVGCHVSTPDGKAVIFTDNWPWNKVAASIEPGLTGNLPATVTPYAATMMKQPWLGMQALSPAHFSSEPGGERMLITSYGARQNPATEPFSATQPATHTLAWFNLAAEDPNPALVYPEEFSATNPYGQDLGNRQAKVGEGYDTAWGLLPLGGEAANAVTPSWSNDGRDIAYVSTDLASTDGHPDWRANAADIKVVPYNDRAGGTAVPLAGASDPGFLEYYPEFSADDTFIAFARAPLPSVATRCVPSQDGNGVVSTCPPQNLGENPDGPYYNRNGEIYIVPRTGGTPIRLAANDPVSCSGETARGSINSWPRWSPRVESSEDGTRYYFLIFSSARTYPGSFNLPTARLTPAISNKSSQLYMATIAVSPEGSVTTYPAIYLWNQNTVVDAAGNPTPLITSNLTPAWDDFSIPEVPPVLQVPR